MPVDARYETLWERVRPTVLKTLIRYPPSMTDDLLQEAQLGVWVNMQRWSPSGGAALSTYALHGAIGRIRHYVADHGYLIRVPRHLRTPGAQFATDRVLDSSRVDIPAPAADLDTEIMLRQALEQLTARELEAVVSSYWRGQPHPARSQALRHLRAIMGVTSRKRPRGRPAIHDPCCEVCGIKVWRYSRRCGPCYQASRRAASGSTPG